MPASAIESRVKRQVLKAILFALPKAMNYTASRIPAFAKRLKQRDLVAWIGLMDGSIGRSWRSRAADSGRVRARRPRRKWPCRSRT